MPVVGPIVGAIVSSVGSIATAKLYEEAVFLSDVRGEFEWIQEELSRISRYLEDADRQAREGNDSIKGWQADVMGVAYDADDAITFFVWMQEQQKRRTFFGRCWFRLCFCCDLCTLHKAGVLIEAVKENIQRISTSRSNFGLREISLGEGHEASSSSLLRLQEYREATLNFEDEIFVGFERNMDELQGNLIRGERRRCVFSIVGMGGTGKTTLARKLYNNIDIKAHFHSNVAWVCVSSTYRIKMLLQKIAEQVMKLERKDSEKQTESQLREKLREFLKERKYLIVLDDIWHKEAWDLLRGAFPDVNEGSRILLTTRIEDVALYADRQSKPHKLPLLNEEESWTLFLKIVFPRREKNGKPICPQHLEGIARQMVAKCGGLPLAIKVLGGLSFTTSDDASEWRKVLDHHLKWQLFHEPEHFQDILALSYLDLPDYLKPCFLYLGIFPEDHQNPVEELTRLWIAEGFIQAREESSEEDVAEQYIGELAKRNMIQVIYYSAEGFLDAIDRYCRVHDMLRDLAIKEAKRVGLIEINDNPPDVSASTSSLSRVRRLGIQHSSNYLWLVQSDRPKVRSLLCFVDGELQPRALGRAKWLRVLHLNEEASKLISDNVFRELVHLKYLRIRGIKSLPSSIDKLYNLQTLDLGWDFIRLPTTIWSLGRLRHLIAHEGFFDGRPRLELLQHLHTLELAADDWIEEKNLIKLSKLRNLRIFEQLEEGVRLGKFGEALIEVIQQMVQLQKLQVQGMAGASVLPPFKPFDDNSRLEEIILSRVRILQEHPQISLEFPPILTRLILSGTHLKDDPMPTLGKLTNLRLLTFSVDAYLGSKLIMPKQGFPQLKHIELVYLCNLEEWIVEEGAMPTLEHLGVHHCDKLGMLPERLWDISTLKELIIEMPSMFCQRLVKNGGEDWHKIQHVHSITVLENDNSR